MFNNEAGHILLRFWHFPIVTLGPGRRIGLWLQGCSIHCAGCIAPENQRFDLSFSVSIKFLMEELKPMLNVASGVTISGGEPLDQPDALFDLLERINENGINDILLYSGYLKDNILLQYPYLSKLIAALIDGSFVEGAATNKIWKGSENQTLTVFKEEYRSDYEQWSISTKRNIQLINKNTGMYLIGIPCQEDNLRDQLLK